MSFFEPWQHYTHPCVRQLAFCIASPSIISSVPSELIIEHSFDLHEHNFWSIQFLQYQTRLEKLDEDPTELLLFMSKLKSTRLGLRFERFLLFWLLDEQYHSFKLIRHSLQQIQGKQTLGELDFLIFNRETQHTEHWEVAIKYYLAESEARLTQWYGLNRHDTLARKLQHFTHKQFQFNTIDQHSIHKKYAVIKGQLFYPSQNASLLAPQWVNCMRRTGFWGNTPLSHLYSLTRHEWIAPNAHHSSACMWWRDGLYCNLNQDVFYMYRQQFLQAPYKYG